MPLPFHIPNGESLEFTVGLDFIGKKPAKREIETPFIHVNTLLEKVSGRILVVDQLSSHPVFSQAQQKSQNLRREFQSYFQNLNRLIRKGIPYQRLIVLPRLCHCADCPCPQPHREASLEGLFIPDTLSHLEELYKAKGGAVFGESVRITRPNSHLNSLLIIENEGNEPSYLVLSSLEGSEDGAFWDLRIVIRTYVPGSRSYTSFLRRKENFEQAMKKPSFGTRNPRKLGRMTLEKCYEKLA